MASVEFGVIGAGNVGVGTARGDAFIRILRHFPEAKVSAVFDIKAENAARAAEAAGASYFTDLESFLDSGVEAVIVCSPVKFHVEQCAAALARNIHVLSEVTAAHSMEAARQLAEAAAGSTAQYMLAENYRYFDEIELIRRMARDGRFGDPYFAEGEYVHDCRDLWLDEAGEPTWRGASGRTAGYGVYCTHSLGPLLYILEDRVTRVSCLANEIGLVVPERKGLFNFYMVMRTARGRTVRVRVDTVSPRPHAATYYSLQGDAGAYEGARGLGDRAKVWLADEHEESHCFESAQWHPLADYAQRYIPERLAVGEEARSGGHGSSEYWLLKDFLAVVQDRQKSPIDAYRALDYTVPGICALESVAQGGAPVAVPDFRPGAQ